MCCTRREVPTRQVRWAVPIGLCNDCLRRDVLDRGGLGRCGLGRCYDMLVEGRRQHLSGHNELEVFITYHATGQE